MPSSVDHLQLMHEGQEGADPGKQGSIPLGTVDEARESLKQFTDSVHQKASNIVSWISSVETSCPESERSKKLLRVMFKYYVFLMKLRFFFELKITNTNSMPCHGRSGLGSCAMSRPPWTPLRIRSWNLQRFSTCWRVRTSCLQSILAWILQFFNIITYNNIKIQNWN